MAIQGPKNKITSDEESLDISPLFDDIDSDTDPMQGIEEEIDEVSSDKNMSVDDDMDIDEQSQQEQPDYLLLSIGGAKGFEPQPVTRWGWTGRYLDEPTPEEIEQQREQWIKDNEDQKDSYLLDKFSAKLNEISKYDEQSVKAEVDREGHFTKGQTLLRNLYNGGPEHDETRKKGRESFVDELKHSDVYNMRENFNKVAKPQ